MALSASTTMGFVSRVAFCALALSCHALAQAQEVIPDFYREPGLNPQRSYVNQSFSEHIDPFTGALQLHYADIGLPGNGGFDLAVVRSYNSASINETNPAAYDGQAGIGWSIHFGRILNKNSVLPCSQSAFGVDTLRNPVLELQDGSRQVLNYTGSSPLMLTTQWWQAECQPGGIGLIVRAPDGTRYDMTQQVAVGAGTAVEYAWYTTKITDRNNNTATISYAGAASPQITSVTTSDGRRIDFSYANGQVRSVTANGATFTYNYQPVSGVTGVYFLTSVTRPDGTSWSYAYNGVLNNVPGSYALRQVTYPEGGNIYYSYGGSTSDYVYFAGVGTLAGRSTVIKSKQTSDGGSWSFSYTPGSVGSYDVTNVNGPEGTTTYRHVGPNYASAGSLWLVGLLIQKVVGGIHAENYTWTNVRISGQQFKRPGAWSASRYDDGVFAPMLRVRHVVRDNQSYDTTFSGFDAFGSPTSIVESGPNGGARTTTVTYYNNVGKWIVRKRQNESVSGGRAVTRDIDGNGNVTRVTVDGVATSYNYYSDGNVQQATFPRSLAHTYSGYARGIPTTEVQPEGVTILRTVDGAGNITRETNGEGFPTSYVYDGLNRVVQITYPVGQAVQISYSTSGKTAARGSLLESTVYDGFRRPTSVTLGGVTTRYQHDALGRATFQSNPGAAEGTRYEYDALGRLTRRGNADGSAQLVSYYAGGKTVVDENNRATSFDYRAYGDPDQLLVMRIGAPDASANVTLSRDARDNVTTVGQGGVVRGYGYDSRGFLGTATHPETGLTNFSRDDAGNLTAKSINGSGAVSMAYDGQNRLVSVNYSDGTPAVAKLYTRTGKLRYVSNGSAVRNFSYDGNDNLVREELAIDAISVATNYAFNGNDQLATMTYPHSGRVVAFSPDVLGRPTSVSSFVSFVSYWPSGQVSQINYGNGVSSLYGQNNRLWPASFTATPRAGVGVATSYSYDPVGNLRSIVDGVDADLNRTLDYDRLDRLTSASGPWGSGSISYDGAGNVTSQQFGGATLSYAYAPNNLLQSVSGTRSATYAYDPLGNVVQAGSSRYRYDAVPNMTCANCDDATTAVSYQYDGLNRRVSSQRGGVKTYEFIGIAGNLLTEFTPSAGNRLVEYFYLGNQRVAQVEPAAPPQPTTIALAGGSSVVAVAGRSLTLTALVTGTNNPTGTVTFYDGSVVLGNATVSAGSASLTTTLRTTGAHTIRIVYSGDGANLASAASVALTVRLDPAYLTPILDLVLD